MIQLIALATCGVLIGVSLGAVGAGGSILAVPVLVYIAGEEPKQATASALVVVLITAVIALRPHWVARRVRLDIALPFAGAGVAGALVGKSLSERLDANVLMLCFSGVMVSAAVLMGLRARSTFAPATPTGHVDGSPSSRGMAPASSLVKTNATSKILGVGMLVGLMTGFFGVGGGFVIVPALVLLLGLPMTESVGTSLVIVAINSAVTFGLKSRGLSLDWHVIATFAMAATVGASFGGAVSRRFDGKTLTKWFVGMVIAVAIYTATRSVMALAG